MSPTGTALFCVPNIAHWYPRFRSTLGMFDYDQRGILDSTHVRFFTRRSLVKLVERRGFAIQRIEPVGLPLDALGVDSTRHRTLRLMDRLLSNPVAHHVRLPVHRRVDARQNLIPGPAAIRHETSAVRSRTTRSLKTHPDRPA